MPVIPDNPFFTSCDEIPYKRPGTPYEITGARTYTRLHKVVVKHREMSNIDVCLCPGLPLPGTTYIAPTIDGAGLLSADTAALLIKQSAETQEGDDWRVWIVTSEYSTRIPIRLPSPGNAAAAAAAQNNPDQEWPEIEWDFETAQEYPMIDLNGNPFTNSADHLLTPGPSIERDYPVLLITRNELSFNFQRANMFARSLNDADFLGAPRGTVMCMPPKSKQKQRGMIYYQRTSYRLKFRCLQKNGTYILPKINVLLPLPPIAPATRWDYEPFPNCTTMVDEWQPLVLDKGMYFRGRETAGDPEESWGRNNNPIISEYTNQQVSHDVLLDGQGSYSRSPDPGATPPEPVPAWYKQFAMYHYRSFAELLGRGVG